MNLVWIRLIPAARYAEYLEASPPRPSRRGPYSGPVFVVPNFHPASCGWLTDFSTERNYCAYSYLDHLDRVRDDPTYRFAISEVNNMMAILAFEPDRFAELKERIREGRVEPSNAFFLEPTINLSGAEALIRMGVEGIRWQERVLGFRPRLIWAIDVTGVHEQMGQIAAGLGVDGVIYTRDNPTSKTLHWLESPDGSRTLGISPGHYSEWGELFNAREPVAAGTIEKLAADARAKARLTPAGAPVLVLGGAGDYSLPPPLKSYPAGFLEKWKEAAPDLDLRFSGPGEYLDAVLPAIRAGRIELPVTRSGARLSWTSFWIQCPRVKGGFRRAEHALQSAEMLAAVASLRTGFAYPAEPLDRSWLQLLLDMDRNTLWGAAGGMVFEHPRSWDAKDRLDAVGSVSARTSEGALRALLGPGRALGLFNPLNWRRRDPVSLELPAGMRPAGRPSQADGGGRTLCLADLPSMGLAGIDLEASPPPLPAAVPAAAAIDTRSYTAMVDPATGALTSLVLKPSGRQVLAGPVLLVAEAGGDGHDTPRRGGRKRLADSRGFKGKVLVRRGPVATVVEAESTFHGGGASRTSIRFYEDSPRIDFDLELNDLPDRTVVVAEFPLAGAIRETRRGIPGGFSHGAWGEPDPRLPGYADGIVAAIRWSHYALAGGGGVALLDRGLPGRELTGNTPVIFLLNAQDTYLGYPCAWLSGKGPQRASFALFAHDGGWEDAGIARMAWEFNGPPILAAGVGAAAPVSFLETSEGVIVEALRREEGHLEVRLVESLGRAGTAEVSLAVPHGRAALTDFLGGRPEPLPAGPSYRFPVRPQGIITMRLETERPVPAVEPLLAWDELVPAEKLAALKKRLRGRKGHPPLGTAPPGSEVPVLPEDAASSLAAGKPAVASNVYQGMASHGGDRAVDGDPATRWATDGGAAGATLEVDLGETRTIGRAWLAEAYDRVREFRIEAQADGAWRPFARGGRIGAGLELTFPPVEARRVRLHITDAPGGPTIWEFLLFPPK